MIAIRCDEGSFATSPAPMAPVLSDQYTGVESVTRFRGGAVTIVRHGKWFDVSALRTDASFFEVFGFDVVAGNPTGLLDDPGTAVVTRDLARRVYDTDDPVGQTLETQRGDPYTIVGVIDRSGTRSHLPFDVLLTASSLPGASSSPQKWGETVTGFYTYVKLRLGVTPEDANEWLRQIHGRFVPEPKEAEIFGFSLQPLHDIHLGPLVSNEVGQGILPGLVGLFLGGLAILLLLAAVFNYVSISVVRSFRRAHEVGVRKAIGAQRGQLVSQFVAEGIGTTLLSFLVGLGFLGVLVVFYNRLEFVQRLGVAIETTPGPILGLIFASFAVLVGILAAAYPAYQSSAYQPVDVLEVNRASQLKMRGISGMNLRKLLVVLQFTTATLDYEHMSRLIQRQTAVFRDFLLIVGLVTSGAVAIGALGLIGIAAYSVESRRKEIGIRKAVGASTVDILHLLGRDTATLVLASVLLGAPLGWWINTAWLTSFAYRIDVSWLTIAVCSASILALALFSILPPTLQATRTDPAQVLRTE